VGNKKEKKRAHVFPAFVYIRCCEILEVFEMTKNIIILVLMGVLGALLVLVFRGEAEDGPGHPFPHTVSVYEVCDPVTKEPKIRICGEQWTDGKWPLLNVFFKDGEAVWRFVTVAPHDPGQWAVERYDTPDANTPEYLSFSRKEESVFQRGPMLWEDMEAQ
jgi:hypothetical protein